MQRPAWVLLTVCSCIAAPRHLREVVEAPPTTLWLWSGLTAHRRDRWNRPAFCAGSQSGRCARESTAARRRQLLDAAARPRQCPAVSVPVRVGARPCQCPSVSVTVRVSEHESTSDACCRPHCCRPHCAATLRGTLLERTSSHPYGLTNTTSQRLARPRSPWSTSPKARHCVSRETALRRAFDHAAAWSSVSAPRSHFGRGPFHVKRPGPAPTTSLSRSDPSEDFRPRQARPPMITCRTGHIAGDPRCGRG